MDINVKVENFWFYLLLHTPNFIQIPYFSCLCIISIHHPCFKFQKCVIFKAGRAWSKNQSFSSSFSWLVTCHGSNKPFTLACKPTYHLKKNQLKQEATFLKINCCNCCWMQGLFEYFHSVVIFTTGWWGSRKLSMVSPLNRIHIQKEEWVPRDEIESRSFVISTVGWWTSFSQ